MNKLAIGIGILFLIALAVPVLAAEGAIVYKDDLCQFWTPGYPDFKLIDGIREKSVQTPSGFSLFTCKGQLKEGVTPPKKAVKIYGIGGNVWCMYGLGATLDWSMVITPSGQARHNCYFRI
jgi:hypothetical protein